MPARNAKKIYQDHAYYHVFNRGCFKSPLFIDQKDYKTFLGFSKKYASRYTVLIVVYALLPNHFHLLLYQANRSAMTKFMTSLGIAYTLYFQKKYNHSGRIFESVYKAILLKTKQKKREAELYILHNPLVAGLENWPFFGKLR